MSGWSMVAWGTPSIEQSESVNLCTAVEGEISRSVYEYMLTLLCTYVLRWFSLEHFGRSWSITYEKASCECVCVKLNICKLHRLTLTLLRIQYLSIHTSCTMKMFFQVPIHWLKWKARISPQWAPVSHTVWNVLQHVHIHDAAILNSGESERLRRDHRSGNLGCICCTKMWLTII